MNARSAAIRNIAAHVAWCLVGRMRKVIHIEVIRAAIHYVVYIRAGARFSVDIRPLVRAVGKRLVAVGEHQRLSALERDERVQLPASDHAIQDAIHVLADGTAAAHRQLIDGSEGQALRSVIGADTFLGP